MSTAQVRRPPTASGLYDVLELILDRGLVIDAYARVSLVGIELLTVDLRVVVASVDTYLRYAEAVERLNLRHEDDDPGVPDMMGDQMTERAMQQKVGSVKDSVKSAVGGGASNKEGGLRGVLSKGADAVSKIVHGKENAGSANGRGQQPASGGRRGGGRQRSERRPGPRQRNRA
jgi:gas vesicle structural protein